MRLCLSGVALAAMMITVPAAAYAQQPNTKVQRDTYLFGIKCYVANEVSATDRRYNADGSHSAAFTANGQKSYNVVWAMGRAIGNSDALIQEDIDSYQTILRGAYTRDDASLQQARKDCADVGLM